MNETNIYQSSFDFYEKQNIANIDSVIQCIAIKTKNSLAMITEFNQVCNNASLMVESTMQTARQVFESHFRTSELPSYEALWHSYAQAYIKQIEHELERFGKCVIQSLGKQPFEQFIERGLHEANSMLKDLEGKVR